MDEQPNEVAVIETAIAYRRGLASTLALAGYEVVEPDDVAAWAEQASALAAIVGAAQDDPERTVARLASEVTVVALVPTPDPVHWWSFVLAGADGVAHRDASPEDIVAVLERALDGMMVVPTEVGRWLAEHAPIPPDGGTGLGPEEAAWLRYLADGKTVAALADQVGYSERTMFRKLYDVYGRLGARNRVEAMVFAQRLGLLGPSSATEQNGRHH